MDIVDKLPQLAEAGRNHIPERALAYHEAGHAYILYRWNHFPEKVRLKPKAGVIFPNHKDLPANVSVYLHLAGPVAQGIYTGSYGWSQGDIDNLKRAIKRHGLTDHQILNAWRQVHAMLRRGWSTVRRISIALYDNDVLYKTDLQKLLL